MAGMGSKLTADVNDQVNNRPEVPLSPAKKSPSTKKSSRIRRLVAPNAFFKPISLVLSETDIIMVFIIPIPPRLMVTRDIKAKKISVASKTLSNNSASSTVSQK